jgi:outer membrane protein assembly factor BamD (BamD/ComL family)
VDPGTKKKVIIISIIVAILFGPLLLLSGWGMSWLEGMAEENSSEEWAASLQLKCAVAYRLTLRPEEELAAYQKFYKVFTAHPRRGYAKYMVAKCLHKAQERSRNEAVRAYEDFLYEFENDPNFQTLPEWREYVEDAYKSIRSIKNSPT